MSSELASHMLATHTRLVPDFPQPGVLFEDLTPVLAHPEAFRAVVDALTEQARAFGADLIGGLDARGFLLGSAVAYNLGVGILAIRKAGKLPPPVHSKTYELEYGTAALEVPQTGIDYAGKTIVLIDDVLATGGTLGAAVDLLQEHCHATVGGCVVVLEVAGLGGRERLGDVPIAVIGNRGQQEQ
ncbi:adenine phosphoribosyltransferase [Corynebacterium choanae]|uniref:Adenine phosphoribosyltransferase n=1 Tax=Corynebacterium choanae TaxID=1862358 RepID=A0A3G6J6G5_9CORY|nr:adenine phosphoribosyltransferase [Corynebacterium choanae]AZA13695.1 Adenine phosphoribosyltransferase [Corynebacterium choanae]